MSRSSRRGSRKLAAAALAITASMFLASCVVRRQRLESPHDEGFVQTQCVHPRRQLGTIRLAPDVKVASSRIMPGMLSFA